MFRTSLLVRPVCSSLRFLGDNDQRAGVERHRREEEVQQDKRRGIEALPVEQPVPRGIQERDDMVNEYPAENGEPESLPLSLPC